MYYYEVLIASQRYHGRKALTYNSKDTLTAGTIVALGLQSQPTLGIVTNRVDRPTFNTKAIVRRIGNNPLPSEQMELIKWLRDYYPAPMGSVIQAFLPSSLLNIPRKTAAISTPSPLQQELIPKLTKDQSLAIKAIQNSSSTTFLLHGDTGTGKTRVYLELVNQALEKGNSAIVLTPEIGLTPQLADSLRKRFGSFVKVLHSMLAPAERRDTWLSLLNSADPTVVVGTRSALFSPVRSLGIIVMDEAHDFAYKQEQAPHYLTSRIAAKLATLHSAKLVMGSATPDIGDYYTIKRKQAPIIRMTKPAIAGTKLPKISLIRIEERKNFIQSSYISDELVRCIDRALNSREQALIFLNRRGTARVVMCGQCGWQALCPNCNTALTYHGDKHKMLCHICAYKSAAPTSCPICNNTDITFRGVGTKYLVQELQRLFPNSKIQRFDTDNTKAERLEQHYREVLAGKVDILVGTQLLSKGLDLPKLSVIGVVLADTGLLIPDYTANETTYQQLCQIIGRVGRGHRKGHVIIQSYQPDNPAIQAAIKREFSLFYKQEIIERRRFGFPPFRYLLKLECERANLKSVESASRKLAEQIKNTPGVEVAGPGPSFYERVRGKYRWQLVVKSRSREPLLDIINSLPANWSYDIDPINLL